MHLWYMVYRGAGGVSSTNQYLGFELTDDEMQQIESLNRDEKHDWY